MTATIIDGNAVANEVRAALPARVAQLRAEGGMQPGLATVLVGADPASQVYVRSKNKRALEAGYQSFEKHMPETTTEAELLAVVDQLNKDKSVHGILVQLPLPRQIDAQRVIEAIDPAKDVDGFHPWNSGRLATGGEALVPCTPLGCLVLLRKTLGDLSGKNAVVVGRSNIVGKPMALLLIRESCTVTVAHSKSQDLPGICRQADILVAAVGRPEMIKGDWIKPGATVIDVGINRVPGAEPGKTRLVGDVAYEEAAKVAGAITPVPGGVGPMTIAMLLANTLTACRRLSGLPDDPAGKALV